MRKTSYIEFYGLPGSGKSTLSHMVAKRLRSVGHSVDEPSFDIDHQHPLPKRIKKFAIGVYWFAFHHEQYKRVWEIVGQNGYTRTEAFKQAVNIFQKMRVYNSRKSAEIVVMDQGLIQACISLSTNQQANTATENYEKLLHLMPNAATASRVYIDVNYETALDRMSKRASNDSRVEKLKEHNLKMEMLEHIHNELASIRELCSGNGKEIVIVSSDNLMRDADVLYDAMKGITI